MNKQKIYNILSSIQMSPRDRKDLVNELTKSKNGGNGNSIIDYIELNASNPSNNINVLKELDLNSQYSCILNIFNTKLVGYFKNGFITIIDGDSLLLFEANYNNGEINSKGKIFIDYIPQQIILTPATSESEDAAYNLEQLQQISALVGSTFNISTSFGIGVATFNNGTGGEAVIENAYGHKIFYTIGTDGSFIKVKETGYEYTDHGIIDHDFEIEYDNSAPFVEYAGEFKFGDTVYNVTFPSYVKLPSIGITEYQPNHTYQYSILNDKCLIVEFAN